jgi:hypothetical protein
VKLNKRLLKALVEKLTNYRATVPVFHTQEQTLDQLDKKVTEAGLHFAKAAGFGDMRYSIRRQENKTVVQFQEGISAHIFHASGAMSLHRGWHPMEKIITSYADRADLKLLQRQTEEALKRLKLVHPARTENFRFERLWRLKASGITADGKTGTVALTRVVGAFRRHIGRLPVWGRASIFVQLAADGQIAATGIDWRPIADKAFAKARLVSPEEGALRVLSELQTFLPGKVFTRNEYIPEFFSLGYFSMPKRRAQAVMQPMFVAMFRSTGPIPSAGRLIVVPASAHGYEPVARSVVAPPPSPAKPAPKVTYPKGRRRRYAK